MATNRNLSGSGDLKENGATIGFVKYELTIFEQNGLRSGQGTIYGDPLVLLAAFDAKMLTLRRADNGKDIGIIVTKYNMTDHAPFQLRGSPD